MKILLVQNDKSLNELIPILQKNTLYFVSADSESAAKGLLEKDSDIGLIILDITVSNNSGIGFAKYLRSQYKYRDLQIILASPNWDRETVIESANLNIGDLLTMPFREELVVSKVRAAMATGKCTILVVDDEPEIREILKYTFELEKFDVLTAPSAEEALEILGKEKIQALISDIMLPSMSGFDLLKVVREKHGRLPVILITGYGGKFTPDDAMKAGADGYFMKPFRNLELIAKLRTILASRAVSQNAYR